MKAREKSFLYSVLLIAPYLWSFLTQSDLNSKLKLGIVCPTILTVAMLLYMSDRWSKKNQGIYGCFLFFAIFSIYMITIASIHQNFWFAFAIVLVVGSVFSFSFLGYEIKYFGYIGYVFAAISLVVVFDYVVGGLTAGWNPNSIGLVGINGVYFLCLSIYLENKRFFWIKIGIVALMLYLISLTGCRSVIFGFFVFLMIRYLLFLPKRFPKWLYTMICAILAVIPYIVMQVYMMLYNSSSRDLINLYVFEKTGKNLFTERELIWTQIFKYSLKGGNFWFGRGRSHANAHSITMDVWFSFGLIGVILFTLLIVFVAYQVYAHFDDLIVKTSMSCFWGLYIGQTFETTFFSKSSICYNNLLYIFLAIAIGRYLYLHQETMKKTLPKKPERSKL